jgi:hypothetical protein
MDGRFNCVGAFFCFFSYAEETTRRDLIVRPFVHPPPIVSVLSLRHPSVKSSPAKHMYDTRERETDGERCDDDEDGKEPLFLLCASALDSQTQTHDGGKGVGVCLPSHQTV